MTYPGTKLAGVDGAGASGGSGRPSSLGAVQAAPSTSPLLVLARSKGGDVFARRVLPPTEAVAVACRWVRENPGLVIEVVRA